MSHLIVDEIVAALSVALAMTAIDLIRSRKQMGIGVKDVLEKHIQLGQPIFDLDSERILNELRCDQCKWWQVTGRRKNRGVCANPALPVRCDEPIEPDFFCALWEKESDEK